MMFESINPLELHNVKRVGNEGGLLNQASNPNKSQVRQGNPLLISASELSALFHLSDKSNWELIFWMCVFFLRV